jgi:ribosomal protein S8
MEFLALWFGSIITSVCLEISMVNRMVKDTLASGYKINLTKMLGLNEFDTNRLAIFIPFYNILNTYQITMQYASNRTTFIENLYNLGYLEEMTENEKNCYSKNPTALNAYRILLDSKKKQENPIGIIFDINAEGKIYYKIGKNLDDTTILKATGIYEKYPIEIQKQMVIDSLKWVVKNGKESSLKERELIKEIKNLIKEEEKIIPFKERDNSLSYNSEEIEEKEDKENNNLRLTRTLKK